MLAAPTSRFSATATAPGRTFAGAGSWIWCLGRSEGTVALRPIAGRSVNLSASTSRCHDALPSVTSRRLEPVRQRWTIDEFHEIYSLPRLESKRLVLLDGAVSGNAQSQRPSRYRTGIGPDGGPESLSRFLGPRPNGVTPQPDNRPHPDIAVVPGTPRDYPQQPTTALLVLEVWDSTLAIDGAKAHLYAKSGIADYWVVDLNNRLLIVHRDPRPEPTAPFGATYGTIAAKSQRDASTGSGGSANIDPRPRPASVIDRIEILSPLLTAPYLLLLHHRLQRHQHWRLQWWHFGGVDLEDQVADVLGTFHR